MNPASGQSDPARRLSGRAPGGGSPAFPSGVDLSTGYFAHPFDLVNVRDLDLIEQARRFCSRLVVGVFSDDFAEHRFGRRPLVPLAERMALVTHLRGVDEVVEHDSDAIDLSGYPVVFAVVDDPLRDPRATTLLLPGRRTASVALREALEPGAQEDVA